ncbi:MAG: ABC transporter substrate-binding protein [Syntrophobacteria bacterium]
MLFRAFCCSAVLFLLIFGLAVPTQAGEPTEQMKLTIDKMIDILGDPALKDPAKAEERRTRMRHVVDERFDWREMARRSLAKHWKQRTEEEKREFVPLFTDLLERAYLKRIENYSGDKVSYDGEKVKGKYSIVKVKIFTDKQVEIPVAYKMKKKGPEWKIYDVSIEGVSLVKNYRQQFDSVILSSSYEGLVEKLKEKAAKN